MESGNARAPAARVVQQTPRGAVATANMHSGDHGRLSGCHSTDLHIYLLLRVSELGRYAHVTDGALF